MDFTREERVRLQQENPTLITCRAAARQGSEEDGIERCFHFQKGMLIRSFRAKLELVEQVVVPLSVSVLCAAHDGLLAGHAGVRATL